MHGISEIFTKYCDRQFVVMLLLYVRGHPSIIKDARTRGGVKSGRERGVEGNYGRQQN